ncbi:MAG TPA: hypothetical protein PLU37_00785 [Chitinophagaceae bacterium]|nr:hypothetical protein [Chitinophagaceae bacterium]MCB9055470.1 DUF1059 domain-containing protein [Chitinophagales bacterium]HPG10033.1 hypothetical protein [Chitinophagaceae bacterium]HRX92863.1 hypothetical protein [Chitinophagaceae bacterium]
MKKMTCRQLGGACNVEFIASTFQEIAEQSKKHGMEMFQQGNAAHLEAMNKMKDLMNDPNALNAWLEDKRKEFESLPDL